MSGNSSPAGRRAGRFGTRFPRALVAMTGIVVAVGAALCALGYVTRPWARSLTVRPLLIGYWQGEAVYQPGDRRVIALHLREHHAQDWSIFNLAGRARVCSPGGNARYSVFGAVRDFRGAQFTLDFSPESTDADLHPGGIKGTWDGQDGLSLHGRLYFKDKNGARGEVSVSPGGEPSGLVRFELRRSSAEAFEAACSSPGHR